MIEASVDGPNPLNSMPLFDMVSPAAYSAVMAPTFQGTFRSRRAAARLLTPTAMRSF